MVEVSSSSVGSRGEANGPRNGGSTTAVALRDGLSVIFAGAMISARGTHLREIWFTGFVVEALALLLYLTIGDAATARLLQCQPGLGSRNG